jgi:SOS-response transcriptional repressor LexA
VTRQPITKRQQELIDFMRAYKLKHGQMPILADMGQALNICTSAAHRLVTLLVDKGVLKKIPGSPRNIAIVEDLTNAS